MLYYVMMIQKVILIVLLVVYWQKLEVNYNKQVLHFLLYHGQSYKSMYKDLRSIGRGRRRRLNTLVNMNTVANTRRDGYASEQLMEEELAWGSTKLVFLVFKRKEDKMTCCFFTFTPSCRVFGCAILKTWRNQAAPKLCRLQVSVSIPRQACTY